MSDRLAVPVTRLAHAAGLPLPAYASAGAAGMDLAAAVTAPLTLAPGARALVPTGLSFALPPGYEAQVRPRSGLALNHGVTVLNAPGTIDADYRGEVCVVLVNHGSEPVVIDRGMRIAQMVVAAHARVAWQEAGPLDETARGGGGFGSTGVTAMVHLPRKTMFAVEAVLDIAFHGGFHPVQSAEITGRQGIPRRYLEQVLQQLVRNGILSGVRGPRGGYRLARERRLVSVGEIVRVLGGLDPLREDEEDGGSELGRLVIQPLWQRLEEDCLAHLDQITIDDLCRQALERGASRPVGDSVDYSI